jgi:hypothetical protein
MLVSKLIRLPLVTDAVIGISCAIMSTAVATAVSAFCARVTVAQIRQIRRAQAPGSTANVVPLRQTQGQNG